MENTSTKHISKLDEAQPSGSDAISEADDHMRFIKDCIKSTFSGITAVGSGNVTADAAELNKLDGYTGTTDDLNTIAGAVSSGLTTADIAKLASVSATATQLNATANIPSNTNTSLSAKAPLASPALTGTPTAPTQSTSDNSTKIATTAYVTAKTSGIPTSSNLADTNAAVALNTAYRGTNDAAVALKANSASPTISDANLTGTPTAPTAGAGVNTTQIASTAFVQSELGDYSTTAGMNSAISTAVSAAAPPSASTTTAGTVELATAAEVAAGVDASRAITAASLLGAVVQNPAINNDGGSQDFQGSLEIAGVVLKWGLMESTLDGDQSFYFQTANGSMAAGEPISSRKNPFPNHCSVCLTTRLRTNAGLQLCVASHNKDYFTINRDDAIDGDNRFFFIAIGG